MDALMPRARTCSPTRFARSSCLMTGAGAATQGYFLLLVQEKVAKENDPPDGATFPATHPAPRESPGRTIPVRPFAGTTVHRTVVCIRLTPAHPRLWGPR